MTSVQRAAGDGAPVLPGVRPHSTNTPSTTKHSKNAAPLEITTTTRYYQVLRDYSSKEQAKNVNEKRVVLE
jgi:hypothetical protein